MNGDEPINTDDERELSSEPVQEQPNESSDATKEEEEEKEKSLTVEQVADQIVGAMHDEDMEWLASFVHPTKGVRFSPYAYVNVESDLVFSQEEMATLMEDETVYQWGVFDGTGDPIELTFEEYFYRFVYDKEYVNAEEIVVDDRLGPGSTLDNTDDVYPEATVVEYHFTGFEPEFEGMDWRSLRLVLEQDGNQWYLVGVIHDEWTI